MRHRFRLGLLYPNATVGKGSPAKTAGQAKHDKPATAHPVANDQSLPQNWDEIDINHVVLAKDDSQWGAWWEAIPVEKAGDGFKLRWREKYAANVPLITRPRLDLALLCPNAVWQQNLDGSVSNRPEPPSAAARNDLICGPF